MNPESNLNDLDSLVKSALAEQGARPLPFGLHRKIENRVRLVMLIQRERAWFVRCLATRGSVFALSLALLGLLVYFAGEMQAPMDEWAPGGQGYLDYAATTVSMAWSRAWDQPSMVLGLAGAAIVALAILPVQYLFRRRSM